MDHRTYFYGKAPHIFERELRRVDFQVDPFHVRSHVENDDFDSYGPNTKFVPRTKSFVLCEDLNSDDEPQCMEFTLEGFWHYLNSDRWGDEFLLRVLDGDLLECILHCLNVLERDNFVISHNNFALAKNSRRYERTFFRQQEHQGDNHIEIDEVLLIDLTYYAKPKKNIETKLSERLRTDSPVSLITTPKVTKDKFSLPFVHQKTPNVKPVAPVIDSKPFLIKTPKSTKFAVDNVETIDTGLLGMEGPIKIAHLANLALQKPPESKDGSGKQTIDKDLKVTKLNKQNRMAKNLTHANKESFFPVSQSNLLIQNKQSNKRLSTIFENHNKPEAKTNTKKLEPSQVEFKFPVNPIKTQRFLKKWNLEGLGYIRRPPGEEYYLQEDDLDMERFSGSTSHKLYYNFNQLLLKKEMEEKEQEDIKEKMMALHPPTPVVVEHEDMQYEHIIRVFSHTPDFMEIAEWIKEGRDPRRKRKKHKKAKQREHKKNSVLTTISEENSTLKAEIPIVVNNGNGHTKKKVARRTHENVLQSDSRTKDTSDESAASIESVAEWEDAEQLEGIIKSNVDRRWSAPPKEPSHLHTPPSNSPNKKRSMSLGANVKPPQNVDHKIISSGKSHKHLLNARNSSIHTVKKDAVLRSWLKWENHLHQKSKSKHSKLVEEEEEPIDHKFCDKLNKTYSHDKFLKQKQIQEHSGKHKPGAKRSDKSPRKNSTPSQTPRKSTVTQNQSPRKNSTPSNQSQEKNPIPQNQQTTKSTGKKLSPVVKSPSTPGKKTTSAKKRNVVKVKKPVEAHTMKVGYLKEFKFLNYSNYEAKDMHITVPDFEVSDLRDFYDNLKKALDDFVIRKENVITNCGFKHVASVTFTRPEVFQKFHL